MSKDFGVVTDGIKMQGISSEVLSHREKHDKVSIENVRGTRGKRVIVSPDRKAIEMLEDAGLWGAYVSVNRAIAIRTMGLGVRAMDYATFSGGGSGNIEKGSDLLIQYDKWATSCRRKCLDMSAVFYMIIDGYSLREIDKITRKASGTAKIDVLACLELWQ